jgi:hypothetical protein
MGEVLEYYQSFFKVVPKFPRKRNNCEEGSGSDSGGSGGTEGSADAGKAGELGSGRKK